MGKVVAMKGVQQVGKITRAKPSYSDLDLGNECRRLICATNANLSPKAHGERKDHCHSQSCVAVTTGGLT